MAKLRKASAYRRLERPYTRKSKYRKKNFVRASPNNLIVKYVLGSTKKEFPVKLELVACEDVQLRHNAIEAGRKTLNKLLEARLGQNFFFKFRMFPHHVLRENPLASGAGADRMSTGMKMSFGKPIGVAVQCQKGKIIAELHVEEKDVETATLALKRMQYKFPIRCYIEVYRPKKASKPAKAVVKKPKADVAKVVPKEPAEEKSEKAAPEIPKEAVAKKDSSSSEATPTP